MTQEQALPFPALETLIDLCGGSMVIAARRCGVNPQTLKNWSKNATDFGLFKVMTALKKIADEARVAAEEAEQLLAAA